jgi:hypothetical protein
MGMDLISKSGLTFDLSGGWWWFYLALAEKCGWKPKGTGKPDHLGKNERWHGGYDSSDGQIVGDDDAKALGAALERALSDPAAAAIIEGLLDEWWKEMQESASDPKLSEQQKKMVIAVMERPEFSVEFTRELINLCKHGEFRID